MKERNKLTLRKGKTQRAGQRNQPGERRQQEEQHDSRTKESGCSEQSYFFHTQPLKFGLTEIGKKK